MCIDSLNVEYKGLAINNNMFRERIIIIGLIIMVGSSCCVHTQISTTLNPKSQEDTKEIVDNSYDGINLPPHQEEIQSDAEKNTPLYNNYASSHQNDALKHCVSVECIMDMILYAGVKVQILFNFWRTSSYLELIISCLVVFFLAIVNECLRFSQTQLHSRHLEYLLQSTQGGATGTSSYGAIQNEMSEKEKNDTNSGYPNRCAAIFVSFTYSLHFMIKEFMGVMIMLILMTFNIWIILSVVIGSGVGYVITAHMTSWRRRCQTNTVLHGSD